MNEVTAAQAAVLTGLSERTIRRQIASGQIPARRVAPNRYGIRVEDLPVRAQIDLQALAARIDALAQRVARLESLPIARSWATRSTASATADPAQVAHVALRDLVAQLSHELEQLSPLLTSEAYPASATSPEGAPAAVGESKSRHKRGLRSLPSPSPHDHRQSSAGGE